MTAAVDLSDFDANLPDRYRLRVTEILDALDGARQASLIVALGDQAHYSNAVIARTVAGWGFPCSPAAVGTWRHRNG